MKKLIIENSQLIEKNIDIFKYVQNIYLSLVTPEDELEKYRTLEEKFSKGIWNGLKFTKVWYKQRYFPKIITYFIFIF